MKIILPPSNSKCVITTVAIGSTYLENWGKYAKPLWEKYCKNHQLGLIVFDQDLIDRQSPFWKKPNWQKMLIGNIIKNSLPTIKNVCFLDTDILINPSAPNVFDNYDSDSIGVVSLRKNLPYPYENVIRRLAFLRNRFYDNAYPLDSALFISVEDLFKFHDLSVQEDEFCSGFFIFNIDSHSEKLNNFFYKYDQTIKSITGGGEQTHFNCEIQKNYKTQWMDYRFQAIWVFEMAWKYPFLYDYGRKDKKLIKECVQASLFTNYFLHFAGSWEESSMWKTEGILDSENKINQFKEFEEYSNILLKGKPIGQILPKKK